MIAKEKKLEKVSKYGLIWLLVIMFVWLIVLPVIGWFSEINDELESKVIQEPEEILEMEQGIKDLYNELNKGKIINKHSLFYGTGKIIILILFGIMLFKIVGVGVKIS